MKKAWIDTDTVTVTVTGGPQDLVVSGITTVQNTGTGGANGKPKAGDKVVIRATITNNGTAAASASETAFTLDGTALPNSPRSTAMIPAGGFVTVDLTWDTRGLKGEHVIAVSADSGRVVTESDEGNNTSTLKVTVQGNKVTNGHFEQSNTAGTGPQDWEGSSTGAGSTGYSQTGGTEGSRAATITGTGGWVSLAGMPTWTSAPIDVAPGETLSLRVSVSSAGLSSAPGVGLAYLGAAGQVLNTVRLLELPPVTTGFTTLEQAVSLPPGVVRVRVILFGFSPDRPGHRGDGDLRRRRAVQRDGVARSSVAAGLTLVRPPSLSPPMTAQRGSSSRVVGRTSGVSMDGRDELREYFVGQPPARGGHAVRIGRQLGLEPGSPRRRSTACSPELARASRYQRPRSPW